MKVYNSIVSIIQYPIKLLFASLFSLLFVFGFFLLTIGNARDMGKLDNDSSEKYDSFLDWYNGK